MKVLTIFLAVLSLCVTESGKRSILNTLHKIGSHGLLDDSDLNILSHAKLVDLPPALRSLVLRTPEGENLCCRNTPINLVTKSRRVARVVVVEDTHSNSHSCGFLNTGTCHQETATYRKDTRYVTEYYKVPAEGQCEPQHIVCCNMYIMVSEKCVHLDDIHELTQNLLG